MYHPQCECSAPASPTASLVRMDRHADTASRSLDKGDPIVCGAPTAVICACLYYFVYPQVFSVPCGASGLRCRVEDNLPDGCMDYRVRVLCPTSATVLLRRESSSYVDRYAASVLYRLYLGIADGISIYTSMGVPLLKMTASERRSFWRGGHLRPPLRGGHFEYWHAHTRAKRHAVGDAKIEPRLGADDSDGDNIRVQLRRSVCRIHCCFHIAVTNRCV